MLTKTAARMGACSPDQGGCDEPCRQPKSPGAQAVSVHAGPVIPTGYATIKPAPKACAAQTSLCPNTIETLPPCGWPMFFACHHLIAQ